MNVFVAGSPHIRSRLLPQPERVPVVPVRHPVFPYEIKRGTGQVFPAGYQVGTELVEPEIRVVESHPPLSLTDACRHHPHKSIDPDQYVGNGSQRYATSYPPLI